MKKLDNINELDALFKDKLSNANVHPPADVWASVSSSLGSGSVISQIGSYFSSVSNIVKVALLAGGVSTAGILLFNENAANEREEASRKAPIENSDLSAGNDQSVNNGSSNNSDHEPGSGTLSSKGNNGPDGTIANDNAEEQNNVSTPTQGQSVEEDPPFDPFPDHVNAKGSNPGTDAPENGLQAHKLSVCMNEKREFTSATAGNWFVNGQLKAKGVKSYTVYFTEEKSYEVRCITDEHQDYLWNVTVQSANVEIIYKEVSDQVYSFGVSADGKEEIKWIVDNEVVSTYARFEKKLTYGSHDIVVIINNGTCTARDAIQILVEPARVELVYNTFSPNGDDGFNDQYMAPAADYTVFIMTVTDRDGNIVFETTDPSKGWNGRNMYTGETYLSGSVFVVSIRYKLEGSSKIDGDFIIVTLR